MVGDDHTPPPDGPQRVLPSLFFFSVGGGSNIHFAVDDGGLREGHEVTRKSKCPFEFELGNLVWGQRGRFRRLETAVFKIGAPAVPLAGNWFAWRLCRAHSLGGVLRCKF